MKNRINCRHCWLCCLSSKITVWKSKLHRLYNWITRVTSVTCSNPVSTLDCHTFNVISEMWFKRSDFIRIGWTLGPHGRQKFATVSLLQIDYFQSVCLLLCFPLFGAVAKLCKLDTKWTKSVLCAYRQSLYPSIKCSTIALKEHM